MKKTFKLFEENIRGIKPVTIEEFVDKIKFENKHKENIISWWNENRHDIKIYYFNFSGIGMHGFGSIFGDDSIAINSNKSYHAQFILFIALHESRHVDQYRMGILKPYFDTVVNNDYSAFLKAYRELEKDANDYAINSMFEIGFLDFIGKNPHGVRGNEDMGSSIFHIMRHIITQYNPSNLIELAHNTIIQS
jgi:hypothetical protein